LAAGGTTRLTADTGVSVNGTLAVTGAITSTSDLTVAEKVIHAGDTDTFVSFPAADTVSVETGGNEALRVDSSGRLLVGTSTARAVGGESSPRLHIEGSGATSNSWINLTRFSANNGSSNIQFAKSRSNTPGTYTVVQDDDILGQLSFLGADGTDMANYAALIRAQVDGTPGSNDMPGRLVFSTTADGAASPTTRLTIDSAGLVKIPDNGKFVAGAGNDLQIEHDGSASYITNSTGVLGIQSDELHLTSKTGGEPYLKGFVNGAVELYHDNSKKFETKSYGALVTGYISASPTSGNLGFHAGDNTKMTFGSSDDLQIYHDGTDSIITSSTGDLQITDTSDDVTITAADDIRIRPQGGENGVNIIGNGSVELYYDNSKKFETTSAGGNLTGNLTVNGNVFCVNVEPTNNIGPLLDNKKILIGNNSDIQIYHDGSNNQINYSNGNLLIRQGNHSSSECLQFDGNGHLFVPDNEFIYFGSGADFKIHHDGSDNYLDSANGNIVFRSVGNDNQIFMTPNGSVELYHDGSKKLNTNSNGVRFIGNLEGVDNDKIRLGNSEDLQLFHDGTNSRIKHNIGTGKLILSGDTIELCRRQDDSIGLRVVMNGATQLSHAFAGRLITTSGGITVTGTVTETSDIAMKKDIEDLTYGLDIIKQLKPRKYKFTNEGNVDTVDIGFVAQEVETVIPEIVKGEEGSKGVSYGHFSSVLTKALQEAILKIETLETKVAALEGA